MSEEFIEPILNSALKSPEDYRNVDLACVTPTIETFPNSFFVDINNLPVWTQRALGACVGHAGAKYAQKTEKSESGEVRPFSARFLYSISKAIDGYPGQGTYPLLMLKQWKKYGCATENTCPNDTTLDHETYCYGRNINKIPSKAFTEALPYAIKSYATAQLTSDGLRNAIINANGAILLMRIDNNWWTDKKGNRSFKSIDILPLRVPIDPQGHEVYLYGYDHENGRLRFWIFNCWTKDWGINGTGYFFFDEYQKYLQECDTVVDLPDNWLNLIHQLPAPGTFKHEFEKPIHYGDTGEEVVALQTALAIDGELKVDPAIFGNFLGQTAIALKAFQVKYNLATPAEIEAIGGKSCGPKTRLQLNKLFN